MSAIDQIRRYQELWNLVLPHIAPPEPEDVARWCAFETDNVETAILRTAARFARHKVSTNLEPTQAYRYVTGTARSIQEQMSAPANRNATPTVMGTARNCKSHELTRRTDVQGNMGSSKPGLKSLH
jgi:hypothetical protein